MKKLGLRNKIFNIIKTEKQDLDLNFNFDFKGNIILIKLIKLNNKIRVFVNTKRFINNDLFWLILEKEVLSQLNNEKW